VSDQGPPKLERRSARPDERRRETFEAQQRSLRRRRSIIGALGFVPLGGALGCGAGVDVLCAMPREGWFAIWAALFGSFLGITIRMFLERRRFQRGATGG
jgi:membrane associated rhomboid family serine protease